MIELQHQQERQRDLARCRRVVVKVGSAVIAGRSQLHAPAIDRLAREVGDIRDRGLEVVLVVSGAVAAGYPFLGLSAPPREVVPRQAAASIGQPLLMAEFSRAFSCVPLSTAQLLVSADDIENRRRFLSARHTLMMLLRRGVVPIINENDALSDDEIKVGDNDHLAALVSQLTSADLLVMLSQVDGVLAHRGHGPRLSRVAPGVDLADHIDATRSHTGTGGMQAKVSAARLAAESGVPTVIADGRSPGLLAEICDGRDIGTLFAPRPSQLSARKQWIAVRTRSRGVLHIDTGAARAILSRGASLLPVGVESVVGDFEMGSRVDIVDANGRLIAMGLVNYNAREIRNMRGRQAAEFERVLGYRYVDEIIEREDLVIVEHKNEESM